MVVDFWKWSHEFVKEYGLFRIKMVNFMLVEDHSVYFWSRFTLFQTNLCSDSQSFWNFIQQIKELLEFRMNVS